MADPLSLVALGAAVGGATGKFVEKAWDSGEKWIQAYFANHQQKSQEKARENSANFLNELAARVKELEDKKEVSKEDIESAQEHPDFSVALQKAMISAAQTESTEKHKLLARILADRLVASPESLLSLAGKMACEAISYMTPNQLQILGLSSNIMHVGPTSPLHSAAYAQYLERRLAPYERLSINNLDLLHLESLSCIKFTPMFGQDLKKLLAGKNSGNFDSETFFASTTGEHLRQLWKDGLQSITLTSVGQIIGVYVTDLLTGSTTTFSGWH
jgi:hypothetical protein